VAKEAAKEAAASKGPKGPSAGSTSTPMSRSINITNLLEEIIDDMLNNRVLKDAGTNFQFKRKTFE
jgi:hypothetical protein